MSWLDSVTDFISGNSSWLKPVVQAGAGLLQNQNQSGTSDKLIDYYKGQEQANYDQAKQNYDAQLAYNQKYDQWSAGNAAASRNAAAARASAAAQTEAARQKAMKKALKIQTAGYEGAKGLFQPYVESGTRILPQMEKTYTGALDQLGMLNALLTTDENKKKAAAAGTPAYNVKLPLPSYLTGAG